MLLTSTFSKENSAISLEEWVLVFKAFTTATRELRDKKSNRDNSPVPDLISGLVFVCWLVA